MYPKGIGYGLGSSGTGYGPVAGSYENGNEPSDSMTTGTFYTFFEFGTRWR